MSLLLPFTLAAILTTDPLGYECVPEEKLEAAFSLGGKGMRLPQTCITDPCAQTFSELTLATYSGYQDEALYRDYRQRMSGLCGAPTLWDDRGITREQLLWAAFDGGSGPIPLPGTTVQNSAAAAGTPSSATIRSRTDRDRTGSPERRGGRSRIGSGAGGSIHRSSFLAPQPASGADPAARTFGETITRPGEDDRPKLPAPVPLPAPFFLLGAAALVLAVAKRWRLGTETAPIKGA